MTANFAVAAFKSTDTGTAITGAISRAIGDRHGDVFNVIDYGADPTGVSDSAPGIQAAVNAALATRHTFQKGGTIYFPAGWYTVNSTINFDGASNDSRLRIVGSGAGLEAQSGSTIVTAQNIYIFTVTRPTWGNPIGSIEGLAFRNNYAPTPGSVTSTEGVNGCIYIVNGQGQRFQACSFYIGGGSGIAVVCFAQNVCFTGCSFQGSFSGTNHDCYGLVCHNASVSDCKMNGFSICIMQLWSGNTYLQARNIDIEVSGCGISLGYSWIAFWDMYDGRGGGTGGTGFLEDIGTPCQCSGLELIAVSMESVGYTDNSAGGCNLYCNNVNHAFIHGCTWANTDGVHLPQYGLMGLGLSDALVNGLTVTGYASIAAIGLSGNGSITFHGVDAYITGGAGVPWKIDLTSGWSAAADGYTFLYCNTDGAQTFANLPPSPTSFGQTMICSDSNAPVWTGTASNVGKPIVGGGSYRVMARAHSVRLAANGAWTTSDTTITMAATIPDWIVAGMKVWDIISTIVANEIGTVSSGAGTTTLTLAAPALNASVGSSDTLQFSQWVIAG